MYATRIVFDGRKNDVSICDIEKAITPRRKLSLEFPLLTYTQVISYTENRKPVSEAGDTQHDL